MSRPPAPRRPPGHAPRTSDGEVPEAQEPRDGGGADTTSGRGAGRGRDVAGAPRPRVPRTPARPVGAADAAALLGSHEESVSTGFQARLRERRRARRHLRGVRLVVLVTVAVLVVGVAWTFLYSPLLALSADSVTVSGQSGDLSAEQVEAKVAPFVGTPLARLDTDALRGAVDTLSPVRSSVVGKVWPRGVSVEVTMRTPAMVVEQGGHYALVDDQGVEVATTDSRPTGLPLVVLPASGQARARAAGDVSAVWAALGSDLRPEVTGVTADGATITLALSSNRSVVWGTAEDSALKAQVLGVLLAQRPATTYDVSSPHRPVTS